MTAQWSPHARELLSSVLRTIARKLYPEDALRWQSDIDECVSQVEAHPFSGDGVPLECFDTIPPNVDELRQTFCRPYRIVYEVVDNEEERMPNRQPVAERRGKGLLRRAHPRLRLPAGNLITD